MTESQVKLAYSIYLQIKEIEIKINELKECNGSYFLFCPYDANKVFIEDEILFKHFIDEAILYYKNILEGLKKELENL